MGRHFYGDVIFSRLLSGYPAQDARPAPAKERQISTRARQSPSITFIFKNGPEAPQLWRGRLSLSLSLSSTNQNFKKTTFLLVNFKNNHDKRCLVSRDWQPQKISAQSVPISQSYDEKL